MKEKEFRSRPACSDMNAPFPAEMTCPGCGEVIEMWSDEDETNCALCGYRAYRHEKYLM